MGAEKYLSEARTKELWAAIKTELAGKVDNATLGDYPTTEAMATAISTALASYSTTSAMNTAIATALASYMTTTEVNAAISTAVAGAAHITIKTPDTLPDTGEENVIYFVPNSGAGTNIKDEYMWINGKWELFGTTEIDLSGYWQKSELRAMTAAELNAILV